MGQVKDVLGPTNVRPPESNPDWQPVRLTRSWQELEADLMSVKAETIEAALIGVEKLEGMFETAEYKSLIGSFLDIMRLEAQNLHRAADKLRMDEEKSKC